MLNLVQEVMLDFQSVDTIPNMVNYLTTIVIKFGVFSNRH